MKTGKLITILSMAILSLSCSRTSSTEEVKQEVKVAHQKRRVATLNGD